MHFFCVIHECFCSFPNTNFVKNAFLAFRTLLPIVYWFFRIRRRNTGASYCWKETEKTVSEKTIPANQSQSGCDYNEDWYRSGREKERERERERESERACIDHRFYGIAVDGGNSTMSAYSCKLDSDPLINLLIIIGGP